MIEPKKEEMDCSKRVDLASLTKVVATMTACALLVEEGAIRWDMPVKYWIPEFHSDEVTLAHLLTHTAGLESDIICHEIDRQELIEAVFSSDVDHKAIGKRIVYSDVGFLLLGMMLERVSANLTDYLERRLFEPLEMTRTGFLPKEHRDCVAIEYCQWRKKMIQGEVHDEKSFPLEGVTGYAGLFSTAEDLLHFCQFILDEGVYLGKRILSPESVRLFKTPYVIDDDVTRSVEWILSTKGNVISDEASPGEHVSYRIYRNIDFYRSCLP